MTNILIIILCKSARIAHCIQVDNRDILTDFHSVRTSNMSLKEAGADKFEDDPFNKLDECIGEGWIELAEKLLGEVPELRYCKL